ncbi:hypothetical protein [Arcobacter cloacae]|uniref:Uncharacterized protein n=1 Tax=Arcobacter cloacae TaxID=1054034 RepID=A0A6M8N6I6_9BACT|nr:hypothetical protein [Arcobacter cloacae]QKF89708.1 hypothetical protein ACLO_1207 [Arcobacter cloacae]RXI40705.1 hypothetical protein CP963_07975 [Arcobacter cloacae]
MISEIEKKLLKFIDDNNSGIVNYDSSDIYISLNDEITILVNINGKEFEEEYEELYEVLEIEISLDQIYNSELSKIIDVNSISFHFLTHSNTYFQVLNFLRTYYKYFSKIPIINITTNGSGYCSYYDLLYEIKIDKDCYSEISFFKEIYNLKQNYEKCSFISKYYDAISWYGWQDFSKKFELDFNSVKIVTTQTKVRRLSYIKMILSMFSKSNYYPDNIFNNKIELEAKRYNEYLLEYINTKGLIDITKSGNSSKPYVETCLSLKLLYSQNNKYQLSKYGKIFNVLSNEIEEVPGNYFSLSKYEKSFFLFFIMQSDNLYLWALLDLIYIQNNKTTIKEIKKVFQEYLINQLYFTVKHSNIPNKEKSKITSLINRINSWKKPQVYLEHIIEPRINWLLDLDLLDKDEFLQNNIVLSKEGYVFFSGLNSYFDIFQEKYTILDHLRCMDFFSLINEMYSMDATAVEEDDIELIENYINESFNLFKTIAPNRVTASQAILYTCFMMLFKAKKVVNFCTIQNYLASKKNTKFIFEWYKTENDGSIRRKK